MTSDEILKARELIAKDAAAEIRPPPPVNPLESTASEMEAYNAWWERDQNFADGARPILPRLLDALEEANNALERPAYMPICAVEVALERAEKAESSLAASDAALVEARQMYCKTKAGRLPSLSARQVAAETWPADADRLFPADGEVKRG